MNREETEKKLGEAGELIATHLGCSNQTWEIQDREYANEANQLVLVFRVEYEEDEEDDEE